jgi:hypothetical protein
MKITIKLNTAYANVGVDAKGKPYAFVKAQALTPEGTSVGVNINPTEWDGIAESLKLFDKLEVEAGNIVADASGRTNSKGEVYKNAVDIDWSTAVVTPSAFGKAVCPSFTKLAENAKVSAKTEATAEEEAVF